MKKLSKKNIKRQLDILWSKLVKILAGGKCQICGSTYNLNSHHIIGRINYQLRWDPRNGICLCCGCHKFNRNSAHNNPLAFLEWFKKTRPDDYEYLLTKKNEVKTFTILDYQEIYQKLKEEHAQLEV